MTKYLKKLLALAVVAGAMTAVAAPTPVATWTDFSSFTPGTALSLTSEEGNHHLAIPANAQLADDGALVVGGNGFDIDYSGTKIVTVELDVAECPTDGKVLMRVLVGGNAMCLESVSDGNLYQRWTQNMGTDWNHAAWEPSERQTITVAYSGPDSPTPTGTQTFRNGEEFIAANAGLRSSSTNISSLGIGYQYDTVKLATGLKVYGIRVYSTRLTAEEVAEAYEEHKPVPPVEDGATPVLLLNVYKATQVDGWINHTQESGGVIGPITDQTSGVGFTTTSVGNFGTYDKVDPDFEDGEYVDIFGETHTSILEEIKTSLGLGEIAFNEDVFKTGVMNAGKNGNIATISGLDPSKTYVVYAGFGLSRPGQNYNCGVKIETTGAYGSCRDREYVVTDAGSHTTKALKYQSFDEGTEITPLHHNLMLVRLVDVVPTQAGEVKFTMSGGDRSGLNFLAVSEVTRNTPTKLSTKLSGEKSWSDLEWKDGEKTYEWIAGDSAEIEVEGSAATLTLDPTVDAKSIKFVGSAALTLTTPDGTKPADEFLAKLRFGEYAGVVSHSWNLKNRIIAINLNKNAKTAQGDDTETADVLGAYEDARIPNFDLQGIAWSQFGGATQATPQALKIWNAKTLLEETTSATVTWSSANVYRWADAQSKIIKGYLDDGGSYAHVNVTGIPFAAYDVYVIGGTDTGVRGGVQNQFSPYTINGKIYKADSDGEAVNAANDTDCWGRTQTALPTLGQNMLVLRNMRSADLTIVGGKNANERQRGGIAAMLIVEADVRQLEITEDTTMSSLVEQMAGFDNVIITVKADAKITQDGPKPTCQRLSLIAEDSYTLSVELTAEQLAAIEALTPNSSYDVATAIFGVKPMVENVTITITNVPENRQFMFIGGLPMIVCPTAEALFTPANSTDWTDRTLPIYAPSVAVTGNKAFAADDDYLQTYKGVDSTVAVVTDAPAGAYIYGLAAIGGAPGLGEITRDIYLKITGGTAHLVSGGDDAGWDQTKTLPHGNLLVNVAGSAQVDQIYGAGHRGGGGNNIDGHVGVVVEGNAQVRGPIAGGYSSIHNASPEVAGNTTVLIKNVQTHKESVVAAQSNGTTYSMDGWIFGGCAYLGNHGGGIIRGNTAVVIDLDSAAEGTFAKPIVGGSYKGSDNNTMTVVGNSSVTITAPATVSFPENIVGGGHTTGTTSSVGGNSSVTLNGGSYTGTITAGGDHANATVAGTATITVAGGDVTGATFVGGTAIGAKTLNLNGGKVLLNNTTMTGFTTIAISPSADVSFPDGWVANTPMTFDCETLNYNGTTTGEVSLQTDIKVGTTTIRNATLVYDLTNKAIYYSAQKSGNLRRRPDADLGAGNDDDPKRAWTYPDSWLDADGNIVSWPESGASYVTIDADEVSSIRVDARIVADMITLVNTAPEEDEPSFKFLTKEPLDEVATPKENPEYVILGKVSANGFGGDLYLQSRITQEIALGENTHIFFVAWVATEETTAYPYTFSNLLHPICKVGPGAFVVPSSMYTYAFNVKGGSLIYDHAGATDTTVSGELKFDEDASGEPHLIIKRGTGAIVYTRGKLENFLNGVEIREGTFKLGLSGAEYEFIRNEPTEIPSVRVKNGGALDLNGRSSFKSNITLEEGATLANDGAGINDQQASIYRVELEGNATVRAKTNEFGILRNGHGDTKLELNGHTLTKVGTGDFYLTHTEGTTGGELRIAEGALRTTRWESSLPEVTLKMADGTTLKRNDALTIKNLTLGANITINGTSALTITNELRYESENANPVFVWTGLASGSLAYQTAPFTMKFDSVPAEPVALPPGNSVQLVVPDLINRHEFPITGVVKEKVAVIFGGVVRPSAVVEVEEDKIVILPALSRRNPITGEMLGFVNAFRGTTDNTWDTLSNWYVMGAADWEPYSGDLAPMVAGSDFSPVLIDGTLIEQEANRTITASTEIEGWNPRLGLYNGVKVTVTSLKKIQQDAPSYFMVDATSKLTIKAPTSSKTEALDLYVAADDGVTWTSAFRSANAMNYYFAGSGSVNYALGVSSGTHKIKRFDLTIGDPNEPEMKRGIVSKALVKFGATSTASFALADDCTIEIADADIHPTVVPKKSPTDALSGHEELGTYYLAKTNNGVYIKYIGYSTNPEQPTQPIIDQDTILSEFLAEHSVSGEIIVIGKDTCEEAFTVTIDCAIPDGVTFRVSGHVIFKTGGDIETISMAKINQEQNSCIEFAAPLAESTLNLTGTRTIRTSVNQTLTLTLAHASTFVVTSNAIATVTASEGQALKGTITIEKDATFVNMLNDAVPYNGDGATINVYGTLDMGTTRWTVGTTSQINLYGAAKVTGTGDGQAAFDVYRNGNTINVWNIEGEEPATATIEGLVRTRNADGNIWIQEGATLALTTGIKGAEANAPKLSRKGAGHLTGTVPLKGPLTLDYGSQVSEIPPRFVVESGTVTMHMTGNNGTDKAITTTDSKDEPFITVNEGATLNFKANNLSGSKGALRESGWIKVGGTFVFQDGEGYRYFREHLVLLDGATVKLNSGTQPVTLYGGVGTESASQIMLEPNMTASIIVGEAGSGNGKFVLDHAEGGEPGAAITVGRNSTLTINAPIEGPDPLTKRGDGKLNIGESRPTIGLVTGTLEFKATHEEMNKLEIVVPTTRDEYSKTNFAAVNDSGSAVEVDRVEVTENPEGEGKILTVYLRGNIYNYDIKSSSLAESTSGSLILMGGPTEEEAITFTIDSRLPSGLTDVIVIGFVNIKTQKDPLNSTIPLYISADSTAIFSGVCYPFPSASGDGAFVFDAEDKTWTVDANNSAVKGDLTIRSGTIKMGNYNQCLGQANFDRQVIVEEGATLDINGMSGQDGEYKAVLRGGSLTNTKPGTAIDASRVNKTFPVTRIDLEADSFIGGTENFGLVRSRYTGTSIYLNGYKLTKVGTNYFDVCNTRVYKGTGAGDGEIVVEEGIFAVNANGCTIDVATLRIETEGTLQIESDKTLTAKNVELLGTELGAGTFKVTGALSGTKAIVSPVTLTNTATLKVRDDGALTFNSTLTSERSSGAIQLDCSAITGVITRVPVLKVSEATNLPGEDKFSGFPARWTFKKDVDNLGYKLMKPYLAIAAMTETVATGFSEDSANDFEAGGSLPSDWRQDAEIDVAINSVTYEYAAQCGYPLANSSHTKVLELRDTSFEYILAAPFGKDIVTSGLYLDTMVKFTPGIDNEIKLGDTVKFAVFTSQATTSAPVKLYAKAGYFTDGLSAESHFYDLTPNGFDGAAWHRLTIKALPLARTDYGDYYGFVVFLDGEKLTYAGAACPTEVAAWAPLQELNPVAAQYYDSAASRNALLPCLFGGAGAETLTGFGFMGMGELDDVVMTSTAPEFAAHHFRYSLTWDDGVESLTVGGDPIDLTAAQPLVKELTDVSETIDLQATFKSGFAADGWVNGARAVTAGDIVAVKSYTEIFSVDGVVYRDTDEGRREAVAAAITGGKPLVISKDYSNRQLYIEYPQGTTERELVIDLNGHTLGPINLGPTIYVDKGVSLKVIDSTNAQPQVFAAPAMATIRSHGPVTIENGTYEAKFERGSEAAVFTFTKKGAKIVKGEDESYFPHELANGLDAVETEVNGKLYWEIVDATEATIKLPEVEHAIAKVTIDGAEQPSAAQYKVPFGSTVVITWTPDEEGWGLVDGDVIVTSVSETIVTDESVTRPPVTEPRVEAYQYTISYKYCLEDGTEVTPEEGDTNTNPTWRSRLSPELTISPEEITMAKYDVVAVNPETIAAYGYGEVEVVVTVARKQGTDWPEDPEEVRGERAAEVCPALEGTDLADVDAAELSIWAKAQGIDFATAGAEIRPEAFLLNCDNTDSAIAEKSAAFKFSADDLATLRAGGELTTLNDLDHNGKLVVYGSTDLKNWHTPNVEGDNFWKAELTFKTVEGN